MERIAPTGQLLALIEALDKGPGPGGYLSLLRSAAIPLVELEPFGAWNEKHYTRTCIVRREAYELLLICFEKGQRTSIHDYNTEEAYVRPMVGSVLEERFEPDLQGGVRQVGSVLLSPESVSHLHDGHSIHRYVNVFPGRSMTLNLYARPLRKWRVYDERTGASHLGPAGS
jgi:cysteine dioxygenase